jgi:hypothetical protein
MLTIMSNNNDTDRITELEQRLDEIEHQLKLAGIALAIVTYATPFRKPVREMVKAIIGGVMNRRPCQH